MSLAILVSGIPPVPAMAAEKPAKSAPQFAVPQPGRKFVFPRDHGSHPEFKVEWWYITGHLYTIDHRRFGYQATFFRRATDKPDSAGSPLFGSSHLFLTHMALLDVQTGAFSFQERLNRNGWDAQASTETLDVACGPWSLRMPDPAASKMVLAGSMRNDDAWQLELTPSKPLVIFGENGVSRKGAAPSAASHYLTFPRLATTGKLTFGSEQFQVRGESWMDHEISSSQLDEDQVGWDWACLQFRDGREAMVYRMRRRDGKADPFSTLAWIAADGKLQHITSHDFELAPLDHWRSPHTGAEYPSGFRLTALTPTGQRQTWRLVPLAKDQELTGAVTGIAYWEGACRLEDELGKEVGSAFVEMTGYAGNLAEKFK